MFTTHFLTFNQKQYSALWLRVRLNAFVLSPNQQKIFKKCHKFEVKFSDFSLTPDLENLYSRYKESVKFNPTDSLEHLLLDYQIFNIFRSKLVEVFDQGKLIAAGVFDVGEKAAQGIVSFYDPEYKKYSLGKFLLLQKVLFLQSQHFEYFYPGYFAPGFKSFDYKLDIAPEVSEYFDLEQKSWKSLANFNPVALPLRKIENKLRQLSQELEMLGIQHDLLKYDFFDLNLTRNYREYMLLDTPRVLLLPVVSLMEEWIIVYNILTQNYEFTITRKAFQTNLEPIPGVYNSFLLKPVRILFSDKEIGSFLQKWVTVFSR